MPPIFVCPKNKEEGEGGSLDRKLSYGELNKVLSSSENLWYCSIICSHVYFFIGQGESRAATSEEALLCWKSLLLSSVASHSSLLVCSCTTCLGLKQASLRRQKEKAGAPPKRLQSTNTALKRQEMATFLIADN